MRACVFVDGENFRYNMLNLFGKPEFQSQFRREDYLPRNAKWGDFFDYLAEQSFGGAKRMRTYWYAVAAVDTRPHIRSGEAEEVWMERNGVYIKNDIKAHDEECENAAEKLGGLTPAELVENLKKRKQRIERRFFGLRVVHRGIADKHKAVEFRHSGAISYNLITRKLGKEKTVDVNLAVDMLQMRDNYDMAIIVSGDQDYLPAVQAAKNEGKTVVNVAFTAKSGRLLPGGAKRLNECTDWSLTVDYHTFAKYLNIAV